MKLHALLSGVPHKGPALDPEITAVVYDSRKAGPGALFVCLPGEQADGHDYAPAAYQAGCRAFLAQRALNLPADAAQALVPDSRSALALVGAAFYGHPADEMHLIGITGTKGKTTTALLTAAILNGAGLPCGYIGSNGADFAGRHEPTANTTPESLELHRLLRAMRDAGVHHCVLEVSSQALRRHRVDGLPFETVAFTNLSPDHVGPGEHPDLADYKAAKRRLFAEYHARAMVYNADDPASEFMRAGFAGQLIPYGLAAGAEYRAAGLNLTRSETELGVKFFCAHNGALTPMQLPLPGAFNVSNALCATALAGTFGVTPGQAAAALARTHVPGRLEVVPGLPGRTFVVDYAHNGLALSSTLRALRAYGPRQLICVFGSVGGRTQLRREELAKAASAGADFSVLTSDDPGSEDPMAILQEIAGHMAPGAPYACIPDRYEAIQAAVRMAQPGDMVLFAGKGCETHQRVGGRDLPFCERALIEQVCRALHPEDAAAR